MIFSDNDKNNATERDEAYEAKDQNEKIGYRGFFAGEGEKFRNERRNKEMLVYTCTCRCEVLGMDAYVVRVRGRYSSCWWNTVQIHQCK